MLLNDKLKPYRLLLASQSPRRRELMTGCGLPYELAEKFDCEETYPDDLPLIGVSEYLSTLKSEAYPVPLLENDILLTAVIRNSPPASTTVSAVSRMSFSSNGTG